MKRKVYYHGGIELNHSQFDFISYVTFEFLWLHICNFRTQIHPDFLDMLCKKGGLKKFFKFTGKHLCQSLLFNKVAGRLELY